MVFVFGMVFYFDELIGFFYRLEYNDESIGRMLYEFEFLVFIMSIVFDWIEECFVVKEGYFEFDDYDFMKEVDDDDNDFEIGCFFGGRFSI